MNLDFIISSAIVLVVGLICIEILYRGIKYWMCKNASDEVDTLKRLIRDADLTLLVTWAVITVIWFALNPIVHGNEQETMVGEVPVVTEEPKTVEEVGGDLNKTLEKSKSSYDEFLRGTKND